MDTAAEGGEVPRFRCGVETILTTSPSGGNPNLDATLKECAVSARYVGPIEAVFGDVVLQRGELVAHDRASFSEDRADELERALAKKPEISYDSTGRLRSQQSS